MWKYNVACYLKFACNNCDNSPCNSKKEILTLSPVLNGVYVSCNLPSFHQDYPDILSKDMINVVYVNIHYHSYISYHDTIDRYMVKVEKYLRTYRPEGNKGITIIVYLRKDPNNVEV